jgi:pyridoxal/pyridoxine/pyridoxamine kinase
MATLPTTAPIIRAGETAPQATVATLQSKTAKTFHHMVPGAKFVMPDGLEVQFLGGQFVTTDPAIIAELSAVADKPASMIFTKSTVVEEVKELQKVAAADAVQKTATPETPAA